MKYFFSKFGQALITLLIISFIVFLAVRVSGNPVETLLPDNATAEQVAEYTAKLGLDKPIIEQYAYFIRDVLKGDLGISYSSKRPVLDMITEKLPYTMELAISAILLAFVFAIVFGSIAAINKDTFIDVLICKLAAVFQATPGFFLAILLVQLLGVKLKIFPITGADTALHLVLPTFVLGLGISTNMVMLLRSNMIEALNSDYIKFARLKGVKEYKIVLKHALRNSFTSVLSLSSFVFAHLIAGSIAIEAVFSWPGIGTLIYNAALSRDFPVVQGIVLILSTVTILISFTIDVATGLIDPRIRTDRSED